MPNAPNYYGVEGSEMVVTCTVKNDLKIDIFWFKGTNKTKNIKNA